MQTCTATLISESHILTNYHCLLGTSPRDRIVDAEIRLGYLSASNQRGETFKVNLNPVEANAELDYAILAVRGRPGLRYGFIQLRVRNPRLGEDLFLVHHPDGAPQQLTRSDCELARSPYAVTTTLIRHHCDTRPGSSGSLLFARNGSGDQFDVVGLHYGGFLYRTANAYNFAKPIVTVVRNSAFLSAKARIAPLAYGQERGGYLAGSSRARWNFSGRINEVVSIALNSTAFDTYLELVSPGGTVLARNDDGGEGRNALIEGFTLPGSGIYNIIVRGYGQEASGSYKLKLSKRGTSLATKAARSQNFAIDASYPYGFRERKWRDRNRYITDVTYGRGNWLVTMSDVPAYSSQYHVVLDTFDEISARIQAKAKEGYAVTDMTSGNGQWALVMTKGPDFTRQSIKTCSCFPEEWVQEKWDESYDITNVSYGDGKWIIVMSKGTGWGMQGWAMRDTYDGIRSYIKQKWDQGYKVSDIAYGNGTWLAVMTKGTGYTAQTFHRLYARSSLRQFAGEQWNEGKRILGIVPDQSGWWILTTKGL